MRARWRSRHDPDAQGGFTLVEAMVGLLLVTVGLMALLTELTTYIRTQGAERSQAQAVRILSSTVEDARALTDAQLTALAGRRTTTAASSVGGDYTLTTDLAVCSLGDPPSQCTPPTGAATTDKRLVATVQWSYGGRSRTLSTSTSVADRSSTTYRATGDGTLGGLLGGTDRQPTVVRVQSMSVAPTSASVTAAGLTTAPVELTLTTAGLTAATTSIPVTWLDDTGSHTAVALGGPTTWTATVPAGGIKKAPASGAVSSSITFTALVPGAPGFTKTTLALTSKPTIVSCELTSAPFVLRGLLSYKLRDDETFTCTTSGLRATDPVRLTYNGTQHKAMTSTDGSTWTVVLPEDTPYNGLLGLVSTVSFDASRDGVAAAQKPLLVTLVG